MAKRKSQRRKSVRKSRSRKTVRRRSYRKSKRKGSRSKRKGSRSKRKGSRSRRSVRKSKRKVRKSRRNVRKSKRKVRKSRRKSRMKRATRPFPVNVPPVDILNPPSLDGNPPTSRYFSAKFPSGPFPLPSPAVQFEPFAPRLPRKGGTGVTPPCPLPVPRPPPPDLLLDLSSEDRALLDIKMLYNQKNLKDISKKLGPGWRSFFSERINPPAWRKYRTREIKREINHIKDFISDSTKFKNTFGDHFKVNEFSKKKMERIRDDSVWIFKEIVQKLEQNFFDEKLDRLALASIGLGFKMNECPLWSDVFRDAKPTFPTLLKGVPFFKIVPSTPLDRAVPNSLKKFQEKEFSLIKQLGLLVYVALHNQIDEKVVKNMRDGC